MRVEAATRRTRFISFVGRITGSARYVSGLTGHTTTRLPQGSSLEPEVNQFPSG
jgi:hypothetical protein